MAGKEYTLAGDSKALYNGAVDTEGGIWVRIRDENDRRLAQAAVDKQLKNKEAANGTLSALDPNSGHLLDYVAEALGRIKDGLNGARPANAQLDGTPIGQAIGESGAAAADEKKPKGKRGGRPSRVGEVLATVPGGPLTPSATSAPGTINWADTVPMPRPEAGQTIRTAQGVATTIATPIGYDGEANAFRVTDTDKWQGLVYWWANGNVWRVQSQALDYPDDMLDVAETALDDEPAAPYAPDAPTPPATPPKPSAQRARNAAHAGVGKSDTKLPPAGKSAAKKPAAAKKRK